MSEWRPIETAPKDGRVLLGWVGNVWQLIAWIDGTAEQTREVKRWFREPKMVVTKPAVAGGWQRLNWIFHECCWGRFGQCNPTHWQPLPDPPKDKP